MTIRYLSRATTDVVARGIMPKVLPGQVQDAVVAVSVHDLSGAEVVHADITMYVSPKSASR
jgi:hypothetical protein